MPSKTAPANPKKRKRKSKTKTSGPTSAAFRFPDLPAELRNKIYTLVCREEATTGLLSARTKGQLISKSPLALHTSRQLRREFHALFSFTVPEIIARVRDFDFGPVIFFFNHCERINLQTLRPDQHGTDDASTSRTMVVDLELTENAHYFTDRLQRWLNRFRRPADEKKGTDLQLVYRVVDGATIQALHRSREIVRGARRRYEGEEKQMEVIEGIVDAIEVQMRAWKDRTGHLWYPVDGRSFWV